MLSVLTTNEKGHRELLEVEDVMMVLRVCAYVRTYLTVYIKYMQFFVYQLFLNKAVKEYVTSE